MHNKMKIIIATFITCVMLLVSACNQASNHNTAQHQQKQPEAQPSSLTRRIPAHFSQQQDLASLPRTLPPEQFTGKVRKAYQVAKDIPQTLTQLPCFCYCDTIGHKSLHSCYESDHSAGCTVCVDSALIADELKKQGVSDSEIRDKLITKYSSTPGH